MLAPTARRRFSSCLTPNALHRRRESPTEEHALRPGARGRGGAPTRRGHRPSRESRRTSPRPLGEVCQAQAASHARLSTRPRRGRVGRPRVRRDRRGGWTQSDRRPPSSRQARTQFHRATSRPSPTALSAPAGESEARPPRTVRDRPPRPRASATRACATSWHGRLPRAPAARAAGTRRGVVHACSAVGSSARARRWPLAPLGVGRRAAELATGTGAYSHVAVRRLVHADHTENEK